MLDSLELEANPFYTVHIQFNSIRFICLHLSIIQNIIYNGKNDFYTISMRDLDAIKESMTCD